MSPTMQHVRGVRYKTLDASIQDVTGRLIEFIASQEVPDRDGDVIEVAGIDTTDFMRNPILLGDHDKSFLLGKITKLWKARLPEGPTLLAKAELLPAGVSARADERYAAIKFGAAKGISIGFLARAHEPTPTGYRYKAISLMEVSQVSIPSCPTCVITSKAAQQPLTSTAHHSTEGYTMQDTDWLEVSDDFFEKSANDDSFDAMCARMLSVYEEMTSFKFRQLMAAQLSVLGPDATIADLVRAIMTQGVPLQEPFDVDMRDVCAIIAKVVAEEMGAQTKAALNAVMGRLD